MPEFDLQFTIYLLTNGVMIGLMYALIALGFVLIYKATDAINFAQGEFVMFAGFIAAAAMSHSLPFWLAAANGKWPEKLDDVTDVPLPDDPVTGKPFEYRLQDNKAVVATPSVTPGKSDGPNGVAYEVYLRQ